jgi:uracil-DNA glycosylase family 4
MTSEPPRSRAPAAPPRSPRGGGGGGAGGGPNDIQELYLNRAIAEIGRLQNEIGACPRCAAAGTLPVMASGSPQAEILMVKPSATLAERQEGVAFFGRAGTAILKSVQRLGIDPLTLYGTLLVKCTHPDPDRGDQLRWLEDEMRIVSPGLVVAMGAASVQALNHLEQPLSEPLREEVGVLQRWTPTVDALHVPDIDESLDEQGAKRAFWAAFRVVGEWHQSQPPY